MNLPTYVIDVDHVTKIISELSVIVLEKKRTKLPLKNTQKVKTSLRVLNSLRVVKELKIDRARP